jgi:nucleotide-binding universal stress UspA family protein
VLCPVDFSEHSRLALRYAEAVARRGKGTLTVTYANDPLLVTAAAVALHDRNIAKRSADELRAFINETLPADAVKALRVKSLVSVGSLADEIMKAAARHRSDVIVMGTHGLTGADRVLMGSTTLSILQRTIVPVLAVPDLTPVLAHPPQWRPR